MLVYWGPLLPGACVRKCHSFLRFSYLEIAVNRLVPPRTQMLTTERWPVWQYLNCLRTVAALSLSGSSLPCNLVLVTSEPTAPRHLLSGGKGVHFFLMKGAV